MSLEWRLPELRTACIPAADAAARRPRLRRPAPATVSHVCPPPPIFVLPPVAGQVYFVPLAPTASPARPERTPLPDGAPDSPRERAGRLPTDSDRPASSNSHTNRCRLDAP